MKSRQKIIPHLWFDFQANEASEFYTKLFPDSKIDAITRYPAEGQKVHGQPEGTVMTVNFDLSGYRFIALNGGPHFRINPSISFFVVCETIEEIDDLWKNLSKNGRVLMPINQYPWSEKYGWIQDQFGVSWQLSLGKHKDVNQKITPCLMFTGNQCGRAEEALNIYTNIFENSSVDGISRYDGTESQDKKGTIKHGQFSLGGEKMMVMDSAMDHPFNFNEGISLLIECNNQEEIDFFWDKLSEGGDPNAQQCGWLKDKFGVSWQVCPSELHIMLLDKDPEKVARVTNAFLQMKKFDLKVIQKIYNNE
ncbi:VOC family protein [Membranihabitans maritimus]|uniref:VOC family protein n=1 Tax=Membranihabitans maritimus TaxID=2904244 RepID=UPI001F367690|nr:VOC family protein [Membranihabitans maritimus]